MDSDAEGTASEFFDYFKVSILLPLDAGKFVGGQ
jgi:hypothetical protein